MLKVLQFANIVYLELDVEMLIWRSDVEVLVEKSWIEFFVNLSRPHRYPGASWESLNSVNSYCDWFGGHT